MKSPHRLPADAKHGFGGAAIDRGKPLSFRFNGQPVEAFEGDTVLSALLAAGIETAGMWHGEPVALDERFSPPIALRAKAGTPDAAMAMDRTPAVGGADLVALGPHERPLSLDRSAPWLARLLHHASHSAERRLDDPRLIEGTWLRATPLDLLEADAIVVGGGVAGMSAALATSGKVVLIERRTTLGGDARFFGTIGDEEPPDELIARLASRIAGTASITVLTSAEAFALSGNRLRVHQVLVENGALTARVMRLTAPRIVLATGAAERLPVFPGNRAPRVTGAVAAFHRAERFGVWQGHSAILATPHNFGYRLALLASDAGVDVQRVTDSRTAPQSRFVDFCKASGITLASGLSPRAADPAPQGNGALSVTFGVTIEGAAGSTETIPTDHLIAAGNWQPRLALWLMGGGRAAYDPRHSWLGARGGLDGIAVVGAAAGYRGTAACVRSGEQAVSSSGETPEPISDPQIDAIFETPPGITPIAPWRAGRGASFLDGGLSFALRPQQLRKDAPVLTPGQIYSLSIGDVVAAVELGSIPVADAGAIAEERSVGGELADTGWRPATTAPAAAAPTDIPAYLHGRFGARPQVVVLLPGDQRNLEPGCLIYPSSDLGDPLVAVGVVLGQPPGVAIGARAVVARAVVAEGIALFVRDTSGPVAVQISEKLKAPRPA